MVKVQQENQYRYFKYDSLGRLIRVKQPEQEINANLNLADSFNTSGQWTAAYKYDGIGNLIKTTDATGVNIINEYDKAGRVTKRCYSKANLWLQSAINCGGITGGNISDTTSAVEYFYDGKGLAQEQTPNYAKGKLTKVTSSISETRYKLFDNFGKLTEMEQRTPVGDETIVNATPRESKYEYDFGGRLVKETYPSGRIVQNQFEADGDLMRVFGKANQNATEKTYVNSFSYTASGGISRMKLGNRIGFNENIGGLSKATTPAIDANTNRFVTGQGFGYDKNGNIVNDISKYNQARNFVFNAENKQTEIRDPNIAVTQSNPDANLIGRYFYDGEGKRVKKVTDTETG